MTSLLQLDTTEDYSGLLYSATPDAAGTGTDVGLLCFCHGTRIATPAGEVAVENLAPGQEVVTFGGEIWPIVWIGVGRVLATSGRRGPATPVIVQKGALGDNTPYYDLRVTKGHSFYIDGVLIPVEFLVNHRTIFWDDRAQEVQLYHIELASHDVLIANGAPAESYHDDGNRWLFQNANPGWGRDSGEPFAPLLTGGPIVDAVWRRLSERAGPRPGVLLTDEPDLHLMVDGRRVDAASRGDGWLAFDLDAAPVDVRIMSRAGVPQELGLGRDARCLGVALRQIMLTQGKWIRVLDADDGRLAAGFHGFEPELNIRWTNGDAAIPGTLFDGCSGAMTFTLRLGGRTFYVDDGVQQRVA